MSHVNYDQEIRNIQKLDISDAEKGRRVRVLLLEKAKQAAQAAPSVSSKSVPQPHVVPHTGSANVLNQKIKEIQSNKNLSNDQKMQQIQNLVKLNNEATAPAVRPAAVKPNLTPEQVNFQNKMKTLVDAFNQERDSIMKSSLDNAQKAAKMKEVGMAFSENQRKLMLDIKLKK